MSQMTKNALADSLKALLELRPVDKITISDITDDCGVNRMTFYYHFQDIYDLLEWSWIREANKVLNGKKTYDTWQQGFLQIFNAVSENKQIVMNIYHSVNREQIEIYLYKLTYDLLFGVIEENAAGMDVRDDDKKFIADFYKYAFVGLILDWIKNGMKADPWQIIEHLDVLIHGDIKKALNKFRTDKINQTAADD
ncbi:TetR/AcrR family transcriptional regulator C-terminal domain-containing protein [Emergencia sp.]|uniref:TetR/AcrR family transcriptional regulator n=1 Tax=Emergencia sp. TaxID=1926557 RepID=UPI003AF0D666